MNKPLVSVGIFTYNQEKYIAQTIESVLIQKCNFDYEILIGEDCSTDGTLKICKEYADKYPDKIKLFAREKNLGLIKNYFDILEKCQGKYIAQCAGDDYWIDEYKLQKQFDFLESNEEYGLVHTSGYYLKKGKLSEINTQDKTNGDVSKKALYWTTTSALTIFFRRDLLKLIDFDEFIKRKFTVEDYPMQAIFSKNTFFGYLPDITAVYRVTRKSISNNKEMEKMIDYVSGYYRAKQYIKELYPNDFDVDEDLENDKLIYLEFRLAKSKFDYSSAKMLYPKFRKQTAKSKNVKLLTRNPILFYTSCIVSYIYSLWKY